MTAIAKAGSLLSIESGEYSDYSVHGFFVVLRDFSPQDELAAHMATKKYEPDEWTRERMGTSAFMAFLIAKGFLLEVPYGVIHTDDYGRIDDFEFRPPVSEKENAGS